MAKTRKAKRKHDDGYVDVVSVVAAQNDEDDEASDDGEVDYLQMLKSQQEFMGAQIAKLEAKRSQKAAKKDTPNPKKPRSSPAATGSGKRQASGKPKASPTATGSGQRTSTRHVTPEQRTAKPKGGEQGEQSNTDVENHIHECVKSRLYHSTKFVPSEQDLETATKKTWIAEKDKRGWEGAPFHLDYALFHEKYGPVIRSKLSTFRQSTQSSCKKAANGK
jgi:hypothetical protein